MDLKELNLEEYFENLDIKDVGRAFPYHVNYIARYIENATKLYKNIHPLVEEGAFLIDKVSLNNHGVGHIKTVMHRASQLVSTSGFQMSPYELYVLLMGIHLHDVGNVLGRESHEKKITEVISLITEHMSALSFEDGIEEESITDIASAHGGGIESLMMLDNDMRILDQPVRGQYIAAIIRIADEISDDVQRAKTFLLKTGKLPEDANIFHLYSYCLKTAEYKPDSRCISYIFRIEEEYVHRTYKKGDKDVYLIDEIYERTLKTFKESVMCAKMLRPYIFIDKVRVLLNIILNERDRYGRIQKKIIQYDLNDYGYPKVEFNQLCPNITPWTGCVISSKLKKNEFEDVRC